MCKANPHTLEELRRNFHQETWTICRQEIQKGQQYILQIYWVHSVRRAKFSAYVVALLSY